MNIGHLRAGLEALVRTRGPARLASDPVSLVRPFANPRDREVAGLVAASLAFGRAPMILKSVRRVLSVLGPRPARAVIEAGGGFAGRLAGFRHRWVGGEDVEALLCSTGRLLRETGSVEEAFALALRTGAGDLRGGLSGLAQRLVRLAGEPAASRRSFRFLLPDPAGGGAAKRFCLYLRWMVRPDDGIDLGLWRSVSPSSLVVPLDTHIHRIARLLGLTKRRSADWKTAVEITAALRVLDPDDPVRFDFALAHLGISGDCPAHCGVCPVAPICAGSPSA
ncbi:MAG: TIGR02757 family protein [Planctomycetes bacterium]|jgi:uncharacterized protein (TIGR02757 family)|nr:TIGR02757 family protein [Planctomycetota bacterium]